MSMKDDKISPVIRLAGEKGNVKVEIAMFYISGRNTEIRSYVNNFAFQRGGSHCDGLRAGLADAFNEYLLKQEINFSKITKSDVGEGLYAVIKVNDPDFAFAPGTNKVKDKDLGENVKSIVKKEFGNYLSENPAIAKELFDKVKMAVQAKRAGEAARKLIQRMR